jgi:hypothetical protein
MKQEMKKFSDYKNVTTMPRSRFLGVSIMFLLVVLLSFPLESVSSQPVNNQVVPMDVDFKDPIDITGTRKIDNLSNRSLAYKSNGQACVVYSYQALHCYNTTAGVWDKVENVQDNDEIYKKREYASLAFDNENDYYVAYYDYDSNVGDGVLNLAYENNFGTRAVETIDDGELDPGYSPIFKDIGRYNSIDVDKKGIIHISYYYHVIYENDLTKEIIEERELRYVSWDGETRPIEPKTVNDYPDEGATGWWTSIVVDDDYNVHISYRDEKYNRLAYAKRKATGGWIDNEIVDWSADVGAFSSITVDSDNVPYISYYNNTGGSLKVAKRNGVKDWGKVVVDNNGDTGWYTSMAIDANDKIHVSYYSPSDGTLKYASKNEKSDAWSVSTLVSKQNAKVGWFTSIAIGTNGEPGVVYFNATDGVLNYIRKKVDDGWYGVIVIASNLKDVGRATSLALTESGVPYITYLDATLSNLMMTRWAGDRYGWITKRFLSDTHAGLYSSIKLDPKSGPKIAFFDSDDQDLIFARISTSWIYSDIDTDNDVGQYVSLALDSSGDPHVSYYDATYKDLYYAKLDGSWKKYKLDFEGDVGQYSSIDITNGKPYISYYDSDNQQLKLARQSDTGAWIIEVVDNGEVKEGVDFVKRFDVGQYSSISVDNSNKRYISYYSTLIDDENVTYKDRKYSLKHAYWDGTKWTYSYVYKSENEDIGKYSSLAVNKTIGEVHVSYLNLTKGELWYASSTNGIDWPSRQLVDEGDVGYYSSIALNENGKPAISYYDNTYGNLMIALSYDLPVFTDSFLPMLIKDN